jgi:inorganic pyrophosphatase
LLNPKWFPLSRLPIVDASSGDVTAVIETPKGSPNKFDYHDGVAAFWLAGVMPEGTTFPYDFGFVPSTLAEDGDSLDVLVFLDAPVVVGCVLTVRLIGVVEAKQRKRASVGFGMTASSRWQPTLTPIEHVRSLDDLRPGLVDEIEDLFRHYNELKGSEFKPVDRGGPKKAQKLLDQAAAAFREKQEDDGKAE